MADHPFYDVCKSAAEHIKKGRLVYQKFTCEKCGERLTMPDANIFFEVGHCEKCNHYSDLIRNGHNYLLVTSGEDSVRVLEEREKEFEGVAFECRQEAVTDLSMTHSEHGD